LTFESYFNHRTVLAESFWERRDFIRRWRRIYARDPRWRAPHLPTLRRSLRELKPLLLWVEALPKEPLYRGSSLEVPVAAAAIRLAGERADSAYLTMLHLANDRTALRALLEGLAETLRPRGVRSLIGPTHLLPHLGGGVLESHWHLPPPPDTPYQPPFVPEHLDALMSPKEALRLFRLGTSAAPSEEAPGLSLTALDPTRLARDLLPLLQAACSPSPALAPPDEAEARAVVRWLERGRPFGLLATLEDTPAGFALLYPERGTTRGRFHPPPAAERGRLMGAVLPAFRRRGLGRALLRGARGLARDRGWSSLSVGPVPLGSEVEGFLQGCGAAAGQRYTLYQYTL